MESNKMMQIVAVVERGEGEEKKNWWTRIGVAFQNRGAWNIRFDNSRPGWPKRPSSFASSSRKTTLKQGEIEVAFHPPRGVGVMLTPAA